MRFKKDVYRNLAMITQLGISMLAPIILCVFIGYQLDAHFGWNTVLPLLILGLLAGCRNCWMLLKQLTPGDGQSSRQNMTPSQGQPNRQGMTLSQGQPEKQDMTPGDGQPGRQGTASVQGQSGKKGQDDEPGA